MENRSTPATLYALDATGQNLLRLDTATPGTVQTTTTITGLTAPGSETLVALDVRPATGQLYALGVTPGTTDSQGRLYVLNTTTGQATAVGSAYTLRATGGYGFDFNPVADRIRIVSDANQNLRLVPDTGEVVGGANDPDLVFGAGDPNAGADPAVVASAYTNSVAGATTTVLFGIDYLRDVLVSHATAPGFQTLTTVGALGFDTTAGAGLDVGPDGTAYALLTGVSAAQLATVNLATGAATAVGTLGGGLLRDIAVAAAGQVAFAADTFAGTEGGTATVTLTRTGDISSTASVQVTTTGGTGVSGTDFTGLPATVTFNPGEATKTLTVNLPENAAVTGLRTVELAVGSPTGGVTVGGQSTAVLNVVDNDGGSTDTTPPTVTIEQASGQADPVAAQPVLFTVTFSEPVTGFDASDVVLSGAAGTRATATVTGTGSTYTVAVSGLTVAGPVRAEVRAGAAADAAGNLSLASTSSDNQVTFNFGQGNGLLRPSARQFAVGAGQGGEAEVRVYDQGGNELYRVTPFPGFSGGVRVAIGDFNNDGTPDLVVGAGPGSVPAVRVLDGKTRTDLLPAIAPFEAGFTGGVFVAAGDVTGDGIEDLVVTPDQGGGPVVVIYDGASLGTGKLVQRTRFFGIEDANFRGGARASVGDVTGDGVGDLTVAAGFGGGPRVAIFDGATVTQAVTGTQLPPKILPDFFVFEPTLRNGVYIAAGDLTGDGKADVIVGGGPGGGPRVFALSGADLVAGKAVQVANFFAGDSDNRDGVRLAVKDLDGDNRADLITGSGADTGGDVTAYLGRNIQTNNTPDEAFDRDPFDVAGGVFVG